MMLRNENKETDLLFTTGPAVLYAYGEGVDLKELYLFRRGTSVCTHTPPTTTCADGAHTIGASNHTTLTLKSCYIA